jgi:hypothetical protein
LITAPDTPREEIVIQARSPSAGVKAGNLSPALADELRLDPGAEGVVDRRRRHGSPAQRSASSAATCLLGQRQKIARRAISTAAAAEPRVWRITLDARRPALVRQLGDEPAPQTRRPTCSPRAGSSRMRRVRSPTSCARKARDVVGQDHLLGPDGALTRMLETRSLGSLMFWGPPGTGKTTVARLLAQATDLHFEQISAIFSGVADLKKVFEQARARRESGRARFCSSTKSTASIARSRIRFSR